MRQHITPAQLQELTDDQKERLGKWWKPESGEKCGIYDIYGKRNPEGVPCLPLLSIGQCIELLHGKFAETISIKYSKYWDQWFVSSDRTDEPETEAGEIIDALWEAVKGVL